MICVFQEGHTTAPRIRAMERDFHPSCFKCEVSYQIFLLKFIFVYQSLLKQTFKPVYFCTKCPIVFVFGEMRIYFRQGFPFP